jgi:hypothetical protein
MGLKSDVLTLKASGAANVGSGNSTLVLDTSAYEAGALFLDITAKTGTFTSYLFALQVSMDGSNWSGIGTQAAPLTTPASVSGAVDIATGRYWVPVTAFAGPFTRLAWVTAGGTNVTFAAFLSVRR